MIKAIIFDMDGTVVHTPPHDLSAWQEVLRDHGVDFSFEDLKRAYGRKAKEILKEKVPEITDEHIDATLKKRYELFHSSIKKKGLQPVSGFYIYINMLKKKYKVAIATGASLEKVKIVMQFIPLEKYFSTIITADDVENGKPNPDLFLKAAETLDVKPEECIVIEDANNGIDAAHRAGMKCIAITTTHARDELKNADKIIDSFDELKIEDLNHLGGGQMDSSEVERL